MWTSEDSHQMFVYGMWGKIAAEQAIAREMIENYMEEK